MKRFRLRPPPTAVEDLPNGLRDEVLSMLHAADVEELTTRHRAQGAVRRARARSAKPTARQLVPLLR